MSQYNRQNVFATFGNLAVAAAGRTVYPVDASAPNAAAGEILVISNGVTINAASVATATNIQIAVGVGPVGGNATHLVYLGGEDINLCETTIDPNVSQPVCGSPQVIDVFLTGCIQPNDVYSIAVNLDDTFVRSNYQTNEKATYIFSASTGVCSTCEDCDTTFACSDLVCRLVDNINGTLQEDPSKITRFIRADLSKQYQPFRAARLFTETLLGEPETTRVFCLTATDGVCEKCSELPGIRAITVDGVTTALVGTTLVSDPTVTSHAQIEQLVSEINRVLGPNGGSAYYKKGIGQCCAYQIVINSCADVITFTVEAGAEDDTLEPCESLNPFTDIDVQAICKDCGADPEDITPTCGFRLFLDPITVPCDCTYPPNLPPPNIYGRTIDVQPVGDGWGCGAFYVKETEAQVLPEGFGYFWQDVAHYQHNGGSGRDWRYGNIHRGKIGLPDEFSRSTNAARGISCTETYCMYNLEITSVKARKFNNATFNINKDINWVLIPDTDTTTSTSWETYLAAFQDRGICLVGAIECHPD